MLNGAGNDQFGTVLFEAHHLANGPHRVEFVDTSKRADRDTAYLDIDWVNSLLGSFLLLKHVR